MMTVQRMAGASPTWARRPDRARGVAGARGGARAGGHPRALGAAPGAGGPPGGAAGHDRAVADAPPRLLRPHLVHARGAAGGQAGHVAPGRHRGPRSAPWPLARSPTGDAPLWCGAWSKGVLVAGLWVRIPPWVPENVGWRRISHRDGAGGPPAEAAPGAVAVEGRGCSANSTASAVEQPLPACARRRPARSARDAGPTGPRRAGIEPDVSRHRCTRVAASRQCSFSVHSGPRI